MGCPAVTTLQLTRLVEIVNTNTRGELLLPETNRATSNNRGGFCATDLALMASLGFLLVRRVTSLFRALMTAGSRATHSVEFAPSGSHISWAYWCPNNRSARVRLKRSTIPWC